MDDTSDYFCLANINNYKLTYIYENKNCYLENILVTFDKYIGKNAAKSNI